MRYITDLHIHSRYSRACSSALTLPNIAKWSQVKGIDIIATGDFTHPAWFKDIEQMLEPAGDGLFRLREKFSNQVESEGSNHAPDVKGGRDVKFVLSTELSCIYKRNDKARRLHLVLMFPSIESVAKFNRSLSEKGFNLKSDGRPILGADARDILEMALRADERAKMIPAHAWTPWFSVFGSKSGFDSLEECFGDLTPHITAVETGLSSDPPMNWRISGLDNIALVSNSDAHGLRNLGREANVFEFDVPSYGAILDAINGQGKKSFVRTIEFFPEEGKYHSDGHRECGFRCEPEETERLGGRCPSCGRLITRGVLGRVFALADRGKGLGSEGKNDFSYIIPLEEVIAEVIGKGKTSKAVGQIYRDCISMIGPEFDVLLDASPDQIGVVDTRLSTAVERMRRGDVNPMPGYDGEFGVIRIFSDKERNKSGQVSLAI